MHTAADKSGNSHISSRDETFGSAYVTRCDAEERSVLPDLETQISFAMFASSD